jgi:hypothetical protein
VTEGRLAHQRKARAYAKPPLGSGLTGRWLSVHYDSLLVSLFVGIVLLNTFDLWTSSVAIRMGLTEANTVAIGLASYLGIQITGGLLILKMGAIIGALIAALIGVRADTSMVRKTVVSVMIFLTLLLLAVSVNNLYLILT